MSKALDITVSQMQRANLILPVPVTDTLLLKPMCPVPPERAFNFLGGVQGISRILSPCTSPFHAPEICRQCGGKCCHRLPGAASPEDIQPLNANVLEKMFAGGLWQVDWFDGEPPKYFIRPTALDHYRNNVFSPSWGGRCVFLEEHGCRLPFEQRPWSCRMLEPKADSRCVAHAGDKSDYGDAWQDYWNLIVDVAESVEHADLREVQDD